MPKIAFKITIKRMAPASTKSPSAAEMSEATMSKMTTKLFNCAQSICQKVVRSFSVNSFRPYLAWRAFTSALDRPVSTGDASCWRVSSAVRACQEISGLLSTGWAILFFTFFIILITPKFINPANCRKVLNSAVILIYKTSKNYSTLIPFQ